MGRAYREVAKLVTEPAEDGSSWHIVQGFIAPFAPGQVLPLALDEDREYCFRWDPATSRWLMLARPSAAPRASRA